MSKPPSHIEQLTTSTKLLQLDILQRPYESDHENRRLWGSKRLVVATFMFFGYFYTFMLRGNLSIALVEMTSNKTVVIGNETIIRKPEFAWDAQTTGWILGLFSYGAIFAGLGGYMSSKYGGVTISGIGILITALLTMASPMAIRTNMDIFVIGRIVEGVFETFAYTGICDVWSRWIPKNELPKVVCFSNTGYYLGAAVTFPICGCIAQWYGWPMIFYFSGFIAVVWSVLLFIYARNDPLQDKKISIEELKYIRRTIRLTERKTITYPWRKIFTSKPVWAVCINEFAYSWGHFTLLFCFPLYIKDVTNQSTSIVGILAGIPNYINLLIAPISGLVIDHLQNNRGFDSSKLQKSIVTFGFLLGGSLFAVVGFCNFTVSMICFILIVILLSINFNILLITVVCISPDHSGFIGGLTAYWYSTSSVIGSIAVGFIVTNHTWLEWSIFFGLSGAVLIFAAIVNAWFGSSNDQMWLSKSLKRIHE